MWDPKVKMIFRKVPPSKRYEPSHGPAPCSTALHQARVQVPAFQLITPTYPALQATCWCRFNPLHPLVITILPRHVLIYLMLCNTYELCGCQTAYRILVSPTTALLVIPKLCVFEHFCWQLPEGLLAMSRALASLVSGRECSLLCKNYHTSHIKSTGIPGHGSRPAPGICTQGAFHPRVKELWMV